MHHVLHHTDQIDNTNSDQDDTDGYDETRPRLSWSELTAFMRQIAINHPLQTRRPYTEPEQDERLEPYRHSTCHPIADY